MKSEVRKVTARVKLKGFVKFFPGGLTGDPSHKATGGWDFVKC